MKDNIQKPDYDRSILSISSSIMKYYNLNSNYKSLQELDKILEKKYKNVIFLILDCLGTKILEDNTKKTSFLRKNLVTNITSVFPPTTAAATIAFHSGKSPLESGWIGWMPYFREYNCMIEAFTGKNYYTREQIVEPLENELLKYETIYEKIIKKNKEIKFHKIFPAKIVNDGASTFKELCNMIVNSCNNKYNNLVSAYWHEPDHTIHHSGINNNVVKNILADFDKNLKELTHRLKDSIIIISADHGAVNTKDVYLNEIKELNDCLALPPAIESRFITFFINKGMKRKFKYEFEKHFSGKYKLYTKNQFLKQNLLGRGKPHERISEYIGDYVVVVYGDINIMYSIDGKIIKEHVADHGGITKDEMLVPLIVIDCNKI